MAIFKEEIRDVAVHGEATGAFVVVPEEVNAGKFGAQSVRGDRVVLLKGSEEMVGMAAVAVLDAKIINNQDESDWAPFVMPKSCHGGALVVAMAIEALAEKVVSQPAGLFETIDSFGDNEVDPIMMGITCEIVFLNNFVGDIRKADSDKFWAIQRGAEVEI